MSIHPINMSVVKLLFSTVFETCSDPDEAILACVGTIHKINVVCKEPMSKEVLAAQVSEALLSIHQETQQ